MAQSWLVTGCSTGIGRAIAEYLLDEGEQVAVTARRKSDVEDIAAAHPETAIALELDVTDEAQVARAVAISEERFGGIDVLVNNAGYGYVSSIEEGDIDAVKALFDTNTFGALRMMQGVLPGMRKRQSGAIVQISSLAGRLSNPATGYYSASKYALEAISEALSREVEALGIKVVSIAPGLFRSDFSGRSLKAEATRIPDYAETAHARAELVKSVDQIQPGDPRKLAAIVKQVAEMESPPRQLIVGPDAYAAIEARMEEIRGAMDAHKSMATATNFD